MRPPAALGDAGQSLFLIAPQPQISRGSRYVELLTENPECLLPPDSPPLRTAPVVPECPHSSTSSLIAPPRSLRSRRSVKDVPEHCVKDVMELNTPPAVQASAARLGFRLSFRRAQEVAGAGLRPAGQPGALSLRGIRSRITLRM